MNACCFNKGIAVIKRYQMQTQKDKRLCGGTNTHIHRHTLQTEDVNFVITTEQDG